MTFEDQLRAALTNKAEAPMASPVEVAVIALPKRKPWLGSVLRDPAGNITGLVLEPLLSVERDSSGEIAHVFPERGGA